MRRVVRKPKFQKMKAKTHMKTRKPRVKKNIERKKVKWNDQKGEK